MRRRTYISSGHKSVGRRVGFSLFLVFSLFYLGFHAISGDRGVLALVREKHRLSSLKEELASISAKREALETKVKLLSSQSLDLDMLDERARAVLGYASADEVIVLPAP